MKSFPSERLNRQLSKSSARSPVVSGAAYSAVDTVLSTVCLPPETFKLFNGISKAEPAQSRSRRRFRTFADLARATRK